LNLLYFDDYTLKNKSKNLEILTILFLTSGDGKLPKSLHFWSFEVFIFHQEKKSSHTKLGGSLT
jgi:hypothetical protein